MALAIITPAGTDGASVRLNLQLGSNRYYAWAIGDAENGVSRSSGIARLADPSHVSELIGPVGNSRRGVTTIEIPRQHFDQRNHHVQVMTFRTADREGPAISDIINVLDAAADFAPVGRPEPPASFSSPPPRTIHTLYSGAEHMTARAAGTACDCHATAHSRDVSRLTSPRPIPMSLRERPPRSEALFLDGLLSGLRELAPKVLPLLGQLLAPPAPATTPPAPGSATPPAPSPPTSTTPPAQTAPTNPQAIGQLVQSIVELIQRPKAASVRARSYSSPPIRSHAQVAPALLALIPLLPKLVPMVTDAIQGFAKLGLQEQQQFLGHLERLNPGVDDPALMQLVGSLSIGRRPASMNARQLAIAHTVSRRAPRSRAQVAPLAALIPLLPQLVPMVTQAIQGFAQLGLEEQKQFLGHLERLNPGVNDPALMQLVGSLSRRLPVHSFARPKPPHPSENHEPATSVTIQLADLIDHEIEGRQVSVFRHGQSPTFPIAVSTPRTIKHATLWLTLLDASTNKVIVRRKFLLENIEPESRVTTSRIDWRDLGSVEPGATLSLKASLIWRTARGRNIGAADSASIVFVSDSLISSIEQAPGEPIPLNDVERHRDWWHKVWQGSFNSEQRRVELNCKYVFALDPGRSTNARMETLLDFTQDRGGIRVGRLKTGLTLSIDSLAALAATIDAGATPLEPEDLDALRSPAVARRLGLAGRSRIRLKGRRGDAAALWVYPEVRFVTVNLRRIDGVSPSGQVEHFADRALRIPIPAAIHLIGTSSEP